MTAEERGCPTPDGMADHIARIAQDEALRTASLVDRVPLLCGLTKVALGHRAELDITDMAADDQRVYLRLLGGVRDALNTDEQGL